MEHGWWEDTTGNTFIFDDFGPVKQLLLSCTTLRNNRHMASDYSKISSNLTRLQGQSLTI